MKRIRAAWRAFLNPPPPSAAVRREHRGGYPAPMTPTLRLPKAPRGPAPGGAAHQHVHIQIDTAEFVAAISRRNRRKGQPPAA